MFSSRPFEADGVVVNAVGLTARIIVDNMVMFLVVIFLVVARSIVCTVVVVVVSGGLGS